MKKYQKEVWTEPENLLLQEYYYVLSYSELAKIMPGRSRLDFAKQVQYLERKNLVFNK